MRLKPVMLVRQEVGRFRNAVGGPENLGSISRPPSLNTNHCTTLKVRVCTLHAFVVVDLPIELCTAKLICLNMALKFARNFQNPDMFSQGAIFS